MSEIEIVERDPFALRQAGIELASLPQLAEELNVSLTKLRRVLWDVRYVGRGKRWNEGLFDAKTARAVVPERVAYITAQAARRVEHELARGARMRAETEAKKLAKATAALAAAAAAQKPAVVPPPKPVPPITPQPPVRRSTPARRAPSTRPEVFVRRAVRS